MDKKHAVTCRTEGCENADISIDLIEPGDVIQCGPCGSIITDIDPPLPAEGYHSTELDLSGGGDGDV